MTSTAAPLVAVLGPTASGKSALGVALARALADRGAPGEVISADSMQLYRGMDIGTAKVTAEEAQGVPHHLLDVLELAEEASVAAYQGQARDAIAQIRSRGGTPLLVGGSGLYVRAVTDVIEFPPTNAELRAQLTQRLEDEGPAGLRAELREADPESASVIRDDRRLVRALEVVRLTGRSFSSFMPTRTYEPAVAPVVQLGLRVDRELLHRRIAARVERMAQQGLSAEVSALLDRGLREGRTASKAIGYQQFLALHDGETSREQAVEDTIVATRKLARRQDTWFRADPRIHWLDVTAETTLESLTEAALTHLEERHLNP